MRMVDGFRWALNVQSWRPAREEWCAAMRRVQPDGGERDRIRRFKYVRVGKK